MKFFKVLLMLSVFVCIGVLNQNCGEFSSYGGSFKDLAEAHSNDTLDLDVDQNLFKARVGERIFVATVFGDVFLPHGDLLSKSDVLSRAGGESAHLLNFVTSNFRSSDKGILNIVVNKVLKQMGDFKGGCSYMSKDETCSSRRDLRGRKADIESEAVSSSTVTREGYRISACSEIIKSDRAIDNVIFNVTGSRGKDFEKGYIGKVYDLFYPAQPMDEDSYEALLEVYEEVLSKGESRNDIWRAVIIPICQSSGWQIP